jgi:hypothetical protein
LLRRRVIHLRRLGNRDAEEAGRVTLGERLPGQKGGEQKGERGKVRSAECGVRSGEWKANERGRTRALQFCTLHFSLCI